MEANTGMSLPYSIFERVLPLPSDGWEEVSGNFFCHNHAHGREEDDDHAPSPSDIKLVPKEGDCLISGDQLVVRGSALDFNKVVMKGEVQCINECELVCVCCLLYTSPSPRDATLSRMPSSA